MALTLLGRYIIIKQTATSRPRRAIMGVSNYLETGRSQEFDGWGHGALDVDGLEIVPSLFEEGD